MGTTIETTHFVGMDFTDPDLNMQSVAEENTNMAASRDAHSLVFTDPMDATCPNRGTVKSRHQRDISGVGYTRESGSVAVQTRGMEGV
jgi:hypothetical protein